jgi:hypothetical protein
MWFDQLRTHFSRVFSLLTSLKTLSCQVFRNFGPNSSTMAQAILFSTDIQLRWRFEWFRSVRPENHIDQTHPPLIASRTASWLVCSGYSRFCTRRRGRAREWMEKLENFYHALIVFYQSTVIPMVRWSFERAWFCLNSSDLLGAVTIDPIHVPERIDVAEFPFEDALLYPEWLRPEQLQESEPRRR